MTVTTQMLLEFSILEPVPEVSPGGTREETRRHEDVFCSTRSIIVLPKHNNNVCRTETSVVKGSTWRPHSPDLFQKQTVTMQKKTRD